MPEHAHTLLRLAENSCGYSCVYHLAFYHPVRAGYQDKISQSLRRFIEGAEPDTGRWIQALTPLVAGELEFDLVIRALQSGETSPAGSSSLYRLCEGIAGSAGKIYGAGRLTKSHPTRSHEKLPGKKARQQELADVFHFDGSELKEDARILVLDYLWTTGSTMEAIAAAVKAALPKAVLVGFTAGKSDGTAPNTHLSEAYFEGGASTPFVDAAARKKSRRVTRIPKPAAASAPAASAVPARAPLAVKTTSSRTRVLVLLLCLVFLVLGALVPLWSGKKVFETNEIPTVEGLPPAEESVTQPPVRERVTSPSREPQVPRGRPAVVAVPETGIRAQASLDAKKVPKVTLRSGERVYVLKTLKPDAGPSWVQIQTRSGKSGWVFASVVRETKSKRQGS